jgi:hypothetical protein
MSEESAYFLVKQSTGREKSTTFNIIYKGKSAKTYDFPRIYLARADIEPLDGTDIELRQRHKKRTTRLD